MKRDVKSKRDELEAQVWAVLQEGERVIVQQSLWEYMGRPSPAVIRDGWVHIDGRLCWSTRAS